MKKVLITFCLFNYSYAVNSSGVEEKNSNSNNLSEDKKDISINSKPLVSLVNLEALDNSSNGNLSRKSSLNSSNLFTNSVNQSSSLSSFSYTSNSLSKNNSFVINSHEKKQEKVISQKKSSFVLENEGQNKDDDLYNVRGVNLESVEMLRDYKEVKVETPKEKLLRLKSEIAKLKVSLRQKKEEFDKNLNFQIIALEVELIKAHSIFAKQVLNNLMKKESRLKKADNNRQEIFYSMNARVKMQIFVNQLNKIEEKIISNFNNRTMLDFENYSAIHLRYMQSFYLAKEVLETSKE